MPARPAFPLKNRRHGWQAEPYSERAGGQPACPVPADDWGYANSGSPEYNPGSSHATMLPVIEEVGESK
jgi:hypothetical protein